MSTVAESLVKTLVEAGVKRIYGIVGDSLNGIIDEIRRQKTIQWVHVRHEEVAAFAAGADAHVTGELAVCAGSCGPGNLHLINGLFDCHRSSVPVLAIAAHIPSAEIGSDYFQETHPEFLFQGCSYYCQLVSTPAQMPRALETAMTTAIARRGVAVIVLSGDVALQSGEHLSATAAYQKPAAPFDPAIGSGSRPARGAAERVQSSHLVMWQRLRRCSRRTAETRRDAQGADGACAARQGVRRVRQPL